MSIRKMKRYTDKEILTQSSSNFAYCSLLEREGVITLDELSELIPGFIHLNNLETYGVEYQSKNIREVLDKSNDDLKKGGRKFVFSLCDRMTQEIARTKYRFLTKNRDKTYSHFQRLRYEKKNIPYSLFYTSAQIYKKKQDTAISFTQPLKLLHQDSFLKEIVEKRFVFFNKNFRKFQTLTHRECEILDLIASGHSNKIISEKLCISLHTVRTHRKNICRKLETGRLIELVKFSEVFLIE